VFRGTDVARDTSERDLGAYRVASAYGKMNALYEGVYSIEICNGGEGKERVREKKEFTVGRELRKAR